MKHLKYFENSIEDKSTPQIGYYIIGKYTYDGNISLNNYINNNIGLIVDITPNIMFPKYKSKYIIPDFIYDNLSNFDKQFIKQEKNNSKYIIIDFSKDEIIYTAPTIEELKSKILSNKYNL